MASLDLGFDYKKAQDKINANKSYKELKKDYDNLVKKSGNAFEKTRSSVSESLDAAKQQKDKFKKEIKSQFDELLDINNITGGKGGNTTKYLKTLFLTALKNIKPKIKEILLEESLKAVGCDQQQVYTQQTMLIRVKAVDIINLLKIDPASQQGKVLYEKEPIQVQINPFSMNKELYQRIQSGQPYSVDNGQNYKGASGQDLFDIQYVEIGGEQYFQVNVLNRQNNVNKVGEFLIDYYETLQPVEFTNILARVLESLSGAFSMNASVGVGQVEDQSKFDRILQRILGLCFDNDSEIDVSGISKLSELDNINESFFEFTEIDLREINQRVTNIQNGVIEFLDCTDAKLPVDSNAIINSLDTLNFVSDDELVNSADGIINTLNNNPEWEKLGLNFELKASVDLNFIKLIAQGLVSALLSPKILLPIYVMLKSLGQTLDNLVNSIMDFMKIFQKFVRELVSKIGALFVQELFELIKRDIRKLIQQIILDIAKEKKNKKLVMILKLVQILLIAAQFISDWRKCKSVVDELLSLLQIATTGWGGEVPLPLLFASRLLDGYSETRAFVGFVEELQKLGIPTGAMPDGSPNLDLISKLALLKSQAAEEAENGKVQIAVGPLTITPAGLTVPATAFGKKM
jgi:hypothetical protein